MTIGWHTDTVNQRTGCHAMLWLASVSILRYMYNFLQTQSIV